MPKGMSYKKKKKSEKRNKKEKKHARMHGKRKED